LGGDIRFNLYRPIEGPLKFCRIAHRPSGWFLQAVCESVPQPLPATGKAVGLDFGIKHLVADSDGNKVDNPCKLQKALKRLRKAQRRLARRKKGSKRHKKAARLVARQHERIANQRKDSLHKVARKYVNAYDTIVVEDLQVNNMARNGQLSRAIADASWSMLRSLIEVKAACAGRRVVAVRPHFTSQRCSSCGKMVEKSLSVRTHVCGCGYVDDRDINAAKNILKAA
jgi:putative transposase